MSGENGAEDAAYRCDLMPVLAMYGGLPPCHETYRNLIDQTCEPCSVKVKEAPDIQREALGQIANSIGGDCVVLSTWDED